jgi:hypothetical protein
MEIFKQINHPQWTNLKIYPEMGKLQNEIGLINDILDSLSLEDIETSYTIYSKYSLFIKENLNIKNKPSQNKFTIFYSDEPNYYKSDILISPELNIHDYYKTIKFNSKFLYFTKNAYNLFKKHFQIYFDGETFNYSNLICLTMIVKNAGSSFENILKENLPFIDRWCILDTGSTDGTQNVIKEILKNKKGVLYEEPFVNFKESRNRCLDLAGTNCQFIVMLDDTYILKGNIHKFLNEVRGDTFADSFSLLIQSDDTEYYSNRIIKSKTKLRYIHTIHEVITDQNNVNVTIPSTEAFIFDYRSDYMEKRTMDRKKYDLELLFKELEETPDDPRTIYYIGQTYGCMDDEINKAKYFEMRIKLDGYIQEKIDALFELARSYNFKISGIEWKRCEELYLEAYNLDQNRPDSLYFIGVHYYLENDYITAYNYFKKAFEIGYPINSQYSLKPTLSFHFLPKFLTEVCYYCQDYLLGIKSAELFINNNKMSDSSNLVFNWYNIHKQLFKMPLISQVPVYTNIICIVTDGGWEPWTGKDIETKGLGGSETWIIETAKNISNCTVVVFCKTNKSDMYNGVSYNPIELFHEFISKTRVEYCIISRYTEYIPVAIKGHAQNIFVVFHDNLENNLIIPLHSKIKCLFGLTKWHANNIKSIFPQFNVDYINYGINLLGTHTKIKNSFIYSSFPNRGLIVLLRMWKKIKEILPDATLNVFCNLDQTWVNSVAKEQMEEIKQTINQEGIKNHGWVSKNVLSEAWNFSDYWLYPCIFEETFCHTALEAAISKTLVITNGLAALSETAKNGIIIEGDPLTQEWQNKCLRIIKEKNYESIEQNYNWAVSKIWKKETEEFVNKIKYWLNV